MPTRSQWPIRKSRDPTLAVRICGGDSKKSVFQPGFFFFKNVFSMRFVGQHFGRSGCERVRIYATMHGAHCCPDSWSLPDVRRVVIAMPGVPGVEFPAVSWRIRAADCPTDFTADLGGGIRGGFRRDFFLVPLLARNARTNPRRNPPRIPSTIPPRKSTAEGLRGFIAGGAAEVIVQRLWVARVRSGDGARRRHNARIVSIVVFVAF